MGLSSVLVVGLVTNHFMRLNRSQVFAYSHSTLLQSSKNIKIFTILKSEKTMNDVDEMGISDLPVYLPVSYSFLLLLL